MNDENVVMERASTRCFVCRLPDDVLAALHADRYQNGVGFEALARKYALADRPLSESGCRRHFGAHVIKPEDSPISGGDCLLDTHEPAVATAELDGHAVLEASTKALTQMLDSLVREHRAVVGQNPRETERLLGVFMKVQGQLQRSLKERDESRARQYEFRKSILPIIKRIWCEAVESIIGLMRDNGRKVREDFSEVAHERMTVDEFWNRLSNAENAWAMEVATRMRKATAEALQAEEDAYARGKEPGGQA